MYADFFAHPDLFVRYDVLLLFKHSTNIHKKPNLMKYSYMGFVSVLLSSWNPESAWFM